MQYRQPRQRCAICITMPVALSTSTACCGHTFTHGVSCSQCMHRMGINASRRAFPFNPLDTFRTSIGVSPVRADDWGREGTLFSAAQAIMQEPHPVQRSRSITMPYRALMRFSFLALPAESTPGRASSPVEAEREPASRRPNPQDAGSMNSAATPSTHT